MLKTLPTALLFAIAVPAFAQDWSLGGGIGPFVFGDFAERRTRIVTETGDATSRSRQQRVGWPSSS